MRERRAAREGGELGCVWGFTARCGGGGRSCRVKKDSESGPAPALGLPCHPPAECAQTQQALHRRGCQRGGRDGLGGRGVPALRWPSVCPSAALAHSESSELGDTVLERKGGWEWASLRVRVRSDQPRGARRGPEPKGACRGGMCAQGCGDRQRCDVWNRAGQPFGWAPGEHGMLRPSPEPVRGPNTSCSGGLGLFLASPSSDWMRPTPPGWSPGLPEVPF